MTPLASLQAAATAVLASAPGDPEPGAGRGPEWGKAAPIGLLVLVLMGVAVAFLLRSFTRQLKKVPASFDPPTDTATNIADSAMTGRTQSGSASGGTDSRGRVGEPVAGGVQHPPEQGRGDPTRGDSGEPAGDRAG